MSAQSNFQLLYIVSDVLLLITTFAAWTICIFTLCRVKRNDDPARRSVSWLKNAFVFYAISVLIYLVTVIFGTARSKIEGDSYDHRPDKALVIIQAGLGACADFCSAIAEVLICVTLLTLDYGIRRVRGGDGAKAKKIVHRLAYGGAGFLITMEIIIVSLGLATIVLDSVLSADGHEVEIQKTPSWSTKVYLDFICACIIFAIAIAIFVESIVVKVRTKHLPQLPRVTRYFIVCGIMLVIRSGYEVYTKFLPLSSTRVGPTSSSDGLFELLTIVLAVWPDFIILTILFAEGVKTDSGLRSPEMSPLITSTESNVGMSPPSMTQSAPISASESPVDPQSPMVERAQQSAFFAAPPSYDQPPPEYSLPEGPLQLGGPSMTATAAANNQSHTQMYEEEMTTFEPPSHDEAMGLYHQADGMRIPRTPLPYPSKQ